MQDFIVIIHTPGQAPKQVLVQASSQAEAEQMAMQKWGASGNVPLTVGSAAGQEGFADQLKQAGSYFDAGGNPISVRTGSDPALSSMAQVGGSPLINSGGDYDNPNNPDESSAYGDTADAPSRLQRGLDQLEGQAPLAAYYRALKSQGFGDITGPGLANRNLQQGFQPSYYNFLGREALGLNAGNANDQDRTGAYQDYARQTAGGPMSQDANQAFREIRAGGTGRDFDPASLPQFLNPEDEDQANVGYNLARTARHGRFSGLLDRYVPRMQDLYSAWLADTGGSSVEGDNWFDRLQKRTGAVR